MLSLARALATSPKLLIADELSLGLAPRVVDVVFEGLANARDAGVTVIMIEQYVDRALAIADQVVLMDRGTTSFVGPVGDVDPAEIVRSYLGVGDDRPIGAPATDAPVS